MNLEPIALTAPSHPFLAHAEETRPMELTMAVAPLAISGAATARRRPHGPRMKIPPPPYRRW